MRATEAKRKLKTDVSHRTKRKLKTVHPDDSHRS